MRRVCFEKTHFLSRVVMLEKAHFLPNFLFGENLEPDFSD